MFPNYISEQNRKNNTIKPINVEIHDDTFILRKTLLRHLIAQCQQKQEQQINLEKPIHISGLK